MPSPRRIPRPLRLAGLACGALLALAGCGDGGFKITRPFARETPGEAARGAFSYDPDTRRASLTKLANAPFGGEEPYLRTYRLLLDDPDTTVRAAAAKALGQHGTADD